MRVYTFIPMLKKKYSKTLRHTVLRNITACILCSRYIYSIQKQLSAYQRKLNRPKECYFSRKLNSSAVFPSQVQIRLKQHYGQFDFVGTARVHDARKRDEQQTLSATGVPTIPIRLYTNLHKPSSTYKDQSVYFCTNKSRGCFSAEH